MLLTTKQVAGKLGVRPGVVRGLIKRGLLTPANTVKPGAKKTEWEFDPRQVREFAATYEPVVLGPRKPKTVTVTGNGHAPTTQMDMLMLTLGRIEEKLDTLLAVWK